ncbi:hypothetical protein Tco_1499317 [Tanacetum coccineum]
MHEKTTSPRSYLRWQPTGRILKTVCLRWVPTGKTFASSTTKVESEPLNGSNADITNQCESKQALNVSAANKTATSRQELELLFHHHIAMLRTTERFYGFDLIPNTSYSRAESESKGVRLGINPMINTERRIDSKDNPKLEKAFLGVEE